MPLVQPIPCPSTCLSIYCLAPVLSVSSSTCTATSVATSKTCHINHVLSITRPVPMVVQVVLGDDVGGGALHHGHGARPSLRRRRFRLSGRPGRRTLPTHAVAGATITTTPGPHRGDRRDRQLRQDGGMTIFRYQVLYTPTQTLTRARTQGVPGHAVGWKSKGCFSTSSN